MATPADRPEAPRPLTWAQEASLRALVRAGGPLTPYQVHPAKPLASLEALVHRGLATRGTRPGTNIITYTATPAGVAHNQEDQHHAQ